MHTFLYPSVWAWLICWDRCQSILDLITRVAIPLKWTHPILFKSSNLFSDERPNTVKSSYWSFRVNAKLYRMPFPNFWNSKLHHDAAFLTDAAQMTSLLHTKNLETKRICKIDNLKWWQFTHHTQYILVFCIEWTSSQSVKFSISTFYYYYVFIYSLFWVFWSSLSHVISLLFGLKFEP